MAFGQPLPPTDVNLPSAAPLAQAMSTPPSLPPIAAAVQQKHGINWLGVLADALSGAVGRQGPYAEMMMQKRQQDIEDQRSQMQSDRELQRQKELYQYEQTNKAPSDSDIQARIDTLNKISPGLGSTYAQNYARNGGGMGLVTDKSTGQEYMQPGAVQPPAEAVSRLRSNPAEASQFDEIFGPGASARVLGGQTAQPSGTFR